MEALSARRFNSAGFEHLLQVSTPRARALETRLARAALRKACSASTGRKNEAVAHWESARKPGRKGFDSLRLLHATSSLAEHKIGDLAVVGSTPTSISFQETRFGGLKNGEAGRFPAPRGERRGHPEPGWIPPDRKTGARAPALLHPRMGERTQPDAQGGAVRLKARPVLATWEAAGNLQYFHRILRHAEVWFVVRDRRQR